MIRPNHYWIKNNKTMFGVTTFWIETPLSELTPFIYPHNHPCSFTNMSSEYKLRKKVENFPSVRCEQHFQLCGLFFQTDLAVRVFFQLCGFSSGEMALKFFWAFFSKKGLGHFSYNALQNRYAKNKKNPQAASSKTFS